MAGAAVISSGLELLGDYWHDERQKSLMDYQRVNQSKLNMESLQNQGTLNRLSPLQQVQGLEAAGINPQTMSGGDFKPGTAPSGSAASGEAARTPLNYLAAMSAESQIAVADAQARKVNAEAEQIELMNENTHSSNSTYDLQIRNKLEHYLQDDSLSNEQRLFAQSMLNNTRTYNQGTFDALMRVMDYDFKKNELDVNNLQTAIDKATKILMLEKDAPVWLADIPRQEWARTNNDIMRLFTLTTLQAANASLTTKESEKIDAEIAKLHAELSSIYHQDFASMWQRGDYGAFFVSFLEKAAESAVGLGTDLLIFKGMGTMKKAVKGSETVKSALSRLSTFGERSKYFDGDKWR